MLKLDMEPGDSVRIGEYAVVTLEQKSGRRARIVFHADRGIPITRTQRPNDAAIAARVGISGLESADQ